MNSYLLLGEPVAGSSNLAYRGTYRPGPVYIDELPLKAPVNQLWMQETELMIGGYLTNLAEAKRIQAIYARAGFYYDLVLIMERGEISPDADTLPLIGYDISHISGYSLLSWDLIFDKPVSEFFHQRENPVYHSLLLLMQKYFRPRLNEYRLFPKVEDADFFLSVASAMKEGFGAVWETVEYGEFSVTKMYMVRSRENIKQLK